MKRILVVVFIAVVGGYLYLANAISNLPPDPRLGFTSKNGFYLTSNHVATGLGYSLKGDNFVLETFTSPQNKHNKRFTLYQGKQILLQDESIGSVDWSRSFFSHNPNHKAYTYAWDGQVTKCTDYPFKYFLVGCRQSRIIIWNKDDLSRPNLTISKRRILKHPNHILDENNHHNIYQKEKRMSEEQRFMRKVDDILATYLNQGNIYYQQKAFKFLGGSFMPGGRPDLENALHEFQKAIGQYEQARRDNWLFWFTPEKPWDSEREANRKRLETWQAKSEKK